jgi:hypothetical protein
MLEVIRQEHHQVLGREALESHPLEDKQLFSLWVHDHKEPRALFVLRVVADRNNLRVALIAAAKGHHKLGFSALFQEFTLERLVEVVNLYDGPVDLRLGNSFERFTDV